MAKSRFEIVAQTIEKEITKPYKYGRADCFMLGCRVADALDKKRGFAKTYGGSYSTLAGAQRALRRRGHKSLVSFFAALLEPVAPAHAVLGDLVIIEIDGAEHVGICTGPSFRTKTERGPRDYPLAACKAAFRT